MGAGLLVCCVLTVPGRHFAEWLSDLGGGAATADFDIVSEVECVCDSQPAVQPETSLWCGNKGPAAGSPAAASAALPHPWER